MNEVPQSIGQLILTSMRYYKQFRLRLLPLSMMFSALFLSSTLINVKTHPNSFVIYFIISYVINVLLAGGLCLQVSALMQNKLMDHKTALKAVLKKTIPLSIAGMMYFIALYVGLLLFIIPGIFLSILLIFFLPILLFEEVMPFGAIKASAKLVYKNWWRTFLTMLVPFSIIIIVIFCFIVFIIYLHQLFSSFSHVIPQYIYFLGIIWLALSFLLPFVFTTLMCLYYDLKKRKASYFTILSS